MRRPRERAERSSLAFPSLLLLLTLLSPAVRAQTPSLPPVAPLDADAFAIACGPRAAFGPPAQSVRVIGSQEGTRFQMYSVNDTLVIGAGSNQGLQVGQLHYVRRLSRRSELRVDGHYPMSLQTAGWVRLTAVLPTNSVAEIVQSCGGFMAGDYLEPFTPPVVPSPVGSPEPDYGQIARLLFGDEGRRLVAPGDLMLIDRGSADGVVPGQRLTIFRAHYPEGGPLTTLAEAIAIEPMPEMTMIKITTGRGALFGGDTVALHRVR